MSQIPLQRRVGVATFFRVLVVCEAAVFLFASALHTGAFFVPPLLAAMIVEGLCGIGFVVAAFALLTRQKWEQVAALVAHLFALVGVLVGITVLIGNSGLRTPINITLHAIMIVLILIGLALLALPHLREALKRDQAV